MVKLLGTNMRWVVYWTVSLAVAVMGAHAAAKPHESGDPVILTGAVQPHLVVPEDRAILLGLGILAIAYTYQRIWQNLKRTAS
jgi:hypothetical protein